MNYIIVILLVFMCVLTCNGIRYDHHSSYDNLQNGYYQNTYPMRPNIDLQQLHRPGCRNCNPPQVNGGNYGYGKVSHNQHGYGYPNIPISGPSFGKFPGKSSSLSSASASNFGGAGHSSSFAETKTGTINLGPLQATFTKTKAKADSHSIGK